MQSGEYVDNVYQVPLRSIAPTNCTHRYTVTSVLSVAVGRGRKYYSGMNRPSDTLVGGWELASSFFLQTGPTIAPPQGYNLMGNIHAAKKNAPDTVDLGMNDCYEIWNSPVGSTPSYYALAPGNPASCAGNIAWRQQAPYAPVTIQPCISAIRASGTQQIDMSLSKSFKFTERVSMQLRLEEFNVIYHPTCFRGVSSYDPSTTTFETVPKTMVGQTNDPRLGASWP